VDPAIPVEKTSQGFRMQCPRCCEEKNLLFRTLGSQITNDFVWKSKAAIHSFTPNFVKLLYLMI